jgi:lipoprotein-anchoring transpeptidase ErfK/SrfK
MSRLLSLVAALACLLTGLVVTPTADATTRRYAVITFHKNYKNTFRSELTWQVFRVTDGKRTTLVSRHWRAGSGFYRTSTNSCRKNRGWLPDGTYRPRLYADYHGNLIKGRAIYLGRKACPNGTMRTDLFIHTEQGAHNSQCPNRKGDQACRWEYPQINDYRSLGCVKLSPHDLKELYDAWRRYFPLGSPGNVSVRVK